MPCIRSYLGILTEVWHVGNHEVRSGFEDFILTEFLEWEVEDSVLHFRFDE